MTVYEVEAPPEVFTEREQRARILEAAALEIEVRGWAKCDYDVETGGVCGNGAIAMTLGWETPMHPSSIVGVLEAAHAWNSDKRHPYCAVADFNDVPGRTADEVTFLLRWRAAEIRDGWDA